MGLFCLLISENFSKYSVHKVVYLLSTSIKNSFVTDNFLSTSQMTSCFLNRIISGIYTVNDSIFWGKWDQFQNHLTVLRSCLSTITRQLDWEPRMIFLLECHQKISMMRKFPVRQCCHQMESTNWNKERRSLKTKLSSPVSFIPGGNVD